MELLQKKLQDGAYYNFGDVQRNAYNIDEQPKHLSTLQYTNNRRQRFITNNDDIIITITLSPRNSTNTREYIENLKNGVYRYFSIKYGTIKEESFIVTIPPYVLESYINNEMVLEDFDVILELGVEE